MVFQTSQSLRPAEAAAGLIADSQIARDIISRVNQEAAAIPFGVFVARGNSDDEAKLIVSATDVLLGVSVRDLYQDNQYLPGNGAIKPKGIFNVMRLGRIWCVTEEATVEGGAVFVRIAVQGSFIQIGAARMTDDATTAASTVRVANARWHRSRDAGLGCVELLGAQTAAVGISQT